MKIAIEKVNKYQIKEEDLKFIPHNPSTEGIGKVGIIISNYSNEELKFEKQDIKNKSTFAYIDKFIQISLKEIYEKLENNCRDCLYKNYKDDMDYFIRISIINSKYPLFREVQFKNIKFKLNRDLLGNNENIEIEGKIDLSFEGYTPIIMNL